MRSVENPAPWTVGASAKRTTHTIHDASNNTHEKMFDRIKMNIFLNPSFFTNEEYYILSERFAQNKTCKEIAKKLGVRHEKVETIFDGALTRLTQRLQLTLSEEERRRIKETIEGQNEE